MEGSIRSEEVIKTESYGKEFNFKTTADSSFRLGNPKDHEVISVEIKDGNDFELEICFWENQGARVGKKMYTLKKNEDGEISIFDCCKNLLKPELTKKEKINAS